MRSAATGAFCVAVLCVAVTGFAAADSADWVTVASTEASAAGATEVTNSFDPAVALMEIGGEATAREHVDFSALSEEGTEGLTEAEQDAVIADMLTELEVEFIHDYGTEADRAELDVVLNDEMAAEDGESSVSTSDDGKEVRFAQRGGFRGFVRRLFGHKKHHRPPPPGAPARPPSPPPAEWARRGFRAGNVSPQALAQQAGSLEGRKMGAGYFYKMSDGLNGFSNKAGGWLGQRMGQPPRPPPPQRGGWLGKFFDKVKAGAQNVGGFLDKWGRRIGGWGKGVAEMGRIMGRDTKIGGLLNRIGGGMNKFGNGAAAIGEDMVCWLNGLEVKRKKRGCVLRPRRLGPPKNGEPGGQGGPKIIPGMAGTYKDAKGKWRGPDGRRVYTAKEQLKRKLKKEQRKEAREARKEARERKAAQKQLKRNEDDKKQLARHLAWRQLKMEEKAERLRRRKNKLDYGGIDPDYPGAGWRKHTPEEVEDCVACRYVWLQVEMDIGNTEMEDNVYDSFNQNAIEAMKQPIFYPAVQMMYDAVDDMIGDYMDGMAVNQICENSLMCRMPEN